MSHYGIPIFIALMRIRHEFHYYFSHVFMHYYVIVRNY